ncbi:MAG: heme ABC transporter ATP-binding protein [Methanomethylovorans sp.]|jgi:iron complex transport system ATP-binding protein|nr:heme ABC transporter ATP-binding protein [Methanomethylovorans sp.]
MLEVKDVCVSYGNRKILNKVNLRAHEGEIVGIVGPNGSGKTTFLKSLAKYLIPDAGSIYINNVNITEMDNREIAKNVAVVSQIVSIDFDFTARDIVLMGRTPYIKGSEKPEDIMIAEDAMRKTNTYEFKDRMVTELSGGELQRVIIARALAQTPKILLLDEPTSHLDIAHQVEILNLVREAADSGLTVIAVIHDLNLAAHYCDSICMLKSGEIVCTGQPETVFTEENIRNTFNIPVEVNTLKSTNSLYIMPLLKRVSKAG